MNLGDVERLQAELEQLTEALTQSWEELDVLFQLADALRAVMDPHQVVSITLENTLKTINAAGAGAYVKASPDEGWQLWEYKALETAVEEFLQSRFAIAIVQQAVRNGKPVLRNTVEWSGKPPPYASGIHSYLVAPLPMRSHRAGAFLLVNALREDGFTAADLKLATTIATQGGTAIEGALLYHELEETFEGTIRVIGMAVDLKSPWTAGHTQRVTMYAGWLAEALKMSNEQRERVEISGLLHDVGKIGVPDDILNKPDRLTAEEYEIMKQHPVRGAEMVSQVRQFRGDIVNGVLYHHEHYNGGGYPEGLKGEDIPWMGRLLAVADAFDAMTSDRPYRPGMPTARALQILTEGAGNQWDPEMVEAFVRTATQRVAKPLAQASH